MWRKKNKTGISRLLSYSPILLFGIMVFTVIFVKRTARLYGHEMSSSINVAEKCRPICGTFLGCLRQNPNIATRKIRGAAPIDWQSACMAGCGRQYDFIKGCFSQGEKDCTVLAQCLLVNPNR